MPATEQWQRLLSTAEWTAAHKSRLKQNRITAAPGGSVLAFGECQDVVKDVEICINRKGDAGQA